MARPRSLRCSFCGRREAEVAKLVAGPRVYICDACVEAARRIMEQAAPSEPPAETVASGCSKWSMCGLLLVGILLLTRFAVSGGAQGQAATGQIPPAVMEALKHRFPKAAIDTWTREEEKGEVIYDIEFKQDGRKFEADIRQDGTIVNWEEAVAASELPGVVRKAIEAKYPGGTVREAMRITAVTGGKEAVEGYEILLETAQKKLLEVTVAPDGRIVEESAVGGEGDREGA